MTGLGLGGALAAVGALALVALVWTARRAGRDAQRVNTLEEVADAKDRQLEAAHDRPRDRAGRARRLRADDF